MKKIRKWIEPLNAGKYNEIVKSFHEETDRAAGILAGAFVEHYLKDFLRTFLKKDTVVDELFDAPFAPLSTFAARAKLAYAMNLISNDSLKDLDIIRAIRNHFAHHPVDTSFKNAEVAGLCAELSTAKSQDAAGLKRSSRESYLFAVGMAVGRMHNAKLKYEQRNLRGERLTNG